MNPMRKLFALSPCLLLLACGSAASTDTAQTPTPPPTRAAAPAGGVALHGVHKGMAYADFRQAVLDQGWQPVVDAQCKANVVGGNYQSLCAKGDLDSCKACDELPELNACSGDGACAMVFHHDNDRLEVGTFGDIGERHVKGSESGLNVTGWSVTAPSAH